MADDADLKNTDTASDRGSSEDRGGGSERHDRSLDRNEHRDRGRSIRDELRASFDEAVERDERYSKKSEPSGRAARAAKEATDTNQPTDAGTAAAPGADGSTGAAAAPDISAPPKSWRSDEKRHYDSLPPAIKNAVHRRETEMAAGVDQIKQKYAAEDAAWAPHEQTIRSFGKDRAATVTQLLGWFQALHQDPLRAFPALVKSMGAERAFQEHLQRQQAQPQAQQDPFQQYAASVEQRLAGFQQTIAQQEEARGEAHANAIINEWKKGKEHFEAVRAQMANLVQSGIIPLRNGSEIDLDAAYSAAVKLHPELFEQTVAERIAAEKKKQRDYADRARRSSASLAPFAPGGQQFRWRGEKQAQGSLCKGQHQRGDGRGGRPMSDKMTSETQNLREEFAALKAEHAKLGAEVAHMKTFFGPWFDDQVAIAKQSMNRPRQVPAGPVDDQLVMINARASERQAKGLGPTAKLADAGFDGAVDRINNKRREK